MWGEPRIRTEAYIVKKEVEKRKKIATQKGLDRLIMDVYHDCIQYYPSWIKNNKNKKSICPQVVEANNTKSKSGVGIEFKYCDKNYKIVRGDRRFLEFSDNYWYDLTLFLNDRKVFEVTEEEIRNEYNDEYNPVFVKAYVNNDWVDDFNNILLHKKSIDLQSSIDYAEDPERTRELMESFGINKVEGIGNVEDINKVNDKNKNSSILSKGCFWIIVIVILLILSKL